MISVVLSRSFAQRMPGGSTHKGLKYRVDKRFKPYLRNMIPLRLKSISKFHRLNRLPEPEHPLISVVDFAKVAEAKRDRALEPIVGDYYTISVKRGLGGKMKYGQQEYDFDEG